MMKFDVKTAWNMSARDDVKINRGYIWEGMNFVRMLRAYMIVSTPMKTMRMGIFSRNAPTIARTGIRKRVADLKIFV